MDINLIRNCRHDLITRANLKERKQKAKNIGIPFSILKYGTISRSINGKIQGFESQLMMNSGNSNSILEWNIILIRPMKKKLVKISYKSRVKTTYKLLESKGNDHPYQILRQKVVVINSIVHVTVHKPRKDTIRDYRQSKVAKESKVHQG